MVKNAIIIPIALVAALALTACDVKKTQSGDVTLPKYEKTQEGSVTVPKYEVTPPDVKVGTTEKTVTVPVVKTEEKTVTVPSITITPAKDK